MRDYFHPTLAGSSPSARIFRWQSDRTLDSLTKSTVLLMCGRGTNTLVGVSLKFVALRTFSGRNAQVMLALQGVFISK